MAGLARHPVLGQADAVPGIEPGVQRSQPGRHGGRRHVEPEEGKGAGQLSIT